MILNKHIRKTHNVKNNQKALLLILIEVLIVDYILWNFDVLIIVNIVKEQLTL